MKEYRELIISGPQDVLLATIAEIENALSDGWARNRRLEEEGRARDRLAPDELRFCFTCTPTISRKGALLVLLSNAEGDLWLSNIVPDELGQLTRDEFNYILEEFVHKFAKPAAAKTGAAIDLSNGVVTIDDWFSPETAAKLRAFLAISGGSTSHKKDRERWMAFLVAAHRERAQVHGDLLRRWLKEDAGCYEHYADRLASEYQTIQEFKSAEELVGA